MGNSAKLYSVLGNFDKLDLSLTPTPLNKLEALSRELGVHLFCKRDDLTGFAFGGNKTRKLDYLIRKAIDDGKDSIITYGSNQSNWCRMTAAAGSVTGLDVHLVLAGKDTGSPTANLLLDHLVGAKITHLDTEDDELLIQEAHKIENELRLAGGNPCYIPVGGSNATGSLGYVRSFAEILDQGEAGGNNFSTIFVASGSSGTQAGLVAGKLISGWKGQIVGIAVSRDSASQREKIIEVAEATLSLADAEINLEKLSEAVIVDDHYLGEGYRRNTAGCAEAIRMFARLEGVFLDEVYTGKAGAGMIDYTRKGLVKPDEKILFLHTGGNIQLFE